MILEHLFVPKSKEVLFLKKDRTRQKDKEVCLKELSLAKSGISRVSKHVRIAMDFNPQSKVKIHVSTLIINEQIGERRKLFLTAEFQPIHTEGIKELDNHHLQLL